MSTKIIPLLLPTSTWKVFQPGWITLKGSRSFKGTLEGFVVSIAMNENELGLLQVLRDGGGYGAVARVRMVISECAWSRNWRRHSEVFSCMLAMLGNKFPKS